MSDPQLIQEKVAQATEILDEFEVDVWLTFVRETSASGDPALQLIYGHDLTWQSALLISQRGKDYAIVGHLEAETARRIGAFDEVIPYHESVRPYLLQVLEALNPRTIGINFSRDDVLADGLGYGLYQVLRGYLDGTPWMERLVSAEKVNAALRGRKTPLEIECIRAAIETTQVIFNETFAAIQPGWSEAQVYAFMLDRMQAHQVQPAWEGHHCPTVNAGPDSPIGHVGASINTIQRGHVLHIDFGVRRQGYCADLQRVAYFLKEGEMEPPEAVVRGFEVVRAAIEECVKNIRPGMEGIEVDAMARRIVTEAGYEEYKYATGHHLGRLTHDGAGILGPAWERYGDTPNYPVEVGHVYTVEPGVFVPEFGYIGLEEDILVTENGGVYLGEPQRSLILL